MPPTDPALPAAALAAIEAAVAQHRTMAAAHDHTPIVLQLHTVERLLAALRRQQARATRLAAALERMRVEFHTAPSADAILLAVAKELDNALAADAEA